MADISEQGKALEFEPRDPRGKRREQHLQIVLGPPRAWAVHAWAVCTWAVHLPSHSPHPAKQYIKPKS